MKEQFVHAGRRAGAVAIAASVALASAQLFAEIKMGAPFADGAVLQRGMKVPVWGRADKAGGTVKVEFAGQSKTGVVGQDGAWKVELDPMEASKESRTMKVSVSGGESAAVNDVLVGEVWFASGQSNMECPIWGGGTRYRDMKGGLMTTMTHLPCVRYVKSPRKWSETPVEAPAKWCKFTPENLQLFDRGDMGGRGTELSAVAFYYARELYLALDVPNQHRRLDAA